MYITEVNHFCLLCREGHSQFSDNDLEDLEGRNAKPGKGKVLRDMLLDLHSDLVKAITEIILKWYVMTSSLLFSFVCVEGEENPKSKDKGIRGERSRSSEWPPSGERHGESQFV